MLGLDCQGWCAQSSAPEGMNWPSSLPHVDVAGLSVEQTQAEVARVHVESLRATVRTGIGSDGQRLSPGDHRHAQQQLKQLLQRGPTGQLLSV